MFCAHLEDPTMQGLCRIESFSGKTQTQSSGIAIKAVAILQLLNLNLDSSITLFTLKLWIKSVTFYGI